MSRSSNCSTDSFLWVKYLLSCDLWCWEALVGKAKAKAKKKTTGARAKRDRRRKLATEAPVSAEELLASVPGLDALQDVPAFDDLPVDEAQIGRASCRERV